MKAYNPIIKAIITEKSSAQQAASKQYAFQVRRDCTKIDVKNAVKEIYGVEVEEVQMLLTPSKKRLIGRGRVLTKRPVMKKALVRLKGGKTMDPNKIKEHKKK